MVTSFFLGLSENLNEVINVIKVIKVNEVTLFIRHPLRFIKVV